MQAAMCEATVQYAAAQIETDSTMTGEDKQISHCFGSLGEADIIMSLVSVRGKNGCVRPRRCSMSVIYGATLVSSRAALQLGHARFITPSHRHAGVWRRSEWASRLVQS